MLLFNMSENQKKDANKELKLKKIGCLNMNILIGTSRQYMIKTLDYAHAGRTIKYL